MRSSRVIRGLPAQLGAAAVVLPALFAVAPDLALGLAPLLALAALLLAGRYPGERIIERLRAQRYARPGRPRPASVSWRRPAPLPRRIGRTAAFALAVRPPPLTA